MLGIGIDVVDIERFRVALDRRPSMAVRLFSVDELAYAEAASDRVPRLAARFAAKEAVMKALGVGIGAFAFRDVEVVHDLGGAPLLAIDGDALDLAADLGAVQWHVSLSHSETVATAIAVVT